MKTRFYAHGLKIIDSLFEVELCTVFCEQNSRSQIYAENLEESEKNAKKIAEILNLYAVDSIL